MMCLVSSPSPLVGEGPPQSHRTVIRTATTSKGDGEQWLLRGGCQRIQEEAKSKSALADIQHHSNLSLFNRHPSPPTT